MSRLVTLKKYCIVSFWSSVWQSITGITQVLHNAHQSSEVERHCLARQARIQGMSAGAGAHPWDGISPFKIYYSIAFKRQSINGRPPLGEILYPPLPDVLMFCPLITGHNTLCTPRHHGSACRPLPAASPVTINSTDLSLRGEHGMRFPPCYVTMDTRGVSQWVGGTPIPENKYLHQGRYHRLRDSIACRLILS